MKEAFTCFNQRLEKKCEEINALTGKGVVTPPKVVLGEDFIISVVVKLGRFDNSDKGRCFVERKKDEPAFLGARGVSGTRTSVRAALGRATRSVGTTFQPAARLSAGPSGPLPLWPAPKGQGDVVAGRRSSDIRGIEIERKGGRRWEIIEDI